MGLSICLANGKKGRVQGNLFEIHFFLLQAGDASGAEITHLTFSKYMKSNQ